MAILKIETPARTDFIQLEFSNVNMRYNYPNDSNCTGTKNIKLECMFVICQLSNS